MHRSIVSFPFSFNLTAEEAESYTTYKTTLCRLLAAGGERGNVSSDLCEQTSQVEAVARWRVFLVNITWRQRFKNRCNYVTCALCCTVGSPLHRLLFMDRWSFTNKPSCTLTLKGTLPLCWATPSSLDEETFLKSSAVFSWLCKDVVVEFAVRVPDAAWIHAGSHLTLLHIFLHLVEVSETGNRLSPFINLLVLIVSNAAFLLNVPRMHCALFAVYVTLLCNKWNVLRPLKWPRSRVSCPLCLSWIVTASSCLNVRM